MEIFVPIQGFEGLYEVSNMGRIKSLKKKIAKRGRNGFYIRKERMLKLKITKGHNRDGYYQCSLCKNGRYNHFLVHRLVAIHFIPNPENKPEVNHRFGIRGDNRASELEWMTKLENMQDCHKRRSPESYNNPTKGSLSKRSKLTEAKVIDIIEKYSHGGTSIRKLATEYGVHHAIIYGVIKGKRWNHVNIKKTA